MSINCPLCEERFDCIMHRAMTSVCGHTVCRLCHDRVRDSCPFCRHPDFHLNPRRTFILENANLFIECQDRIDYFDKLYRSGEGDVEITVENKKIKLHSFVGLISPFIRRKLSNNQYKIYVSHPDKIKTTSLMWIKQYLYFGNPAEIESLLQGVEIMELSTILKLKSSWEYAAEWVSRNIDCEHVVRIMKQVKFHPFTRLSADCYNIVKVNIENLWKKKENLVKLPYILFEAALYFLKSKEEKELRKLVSNYIGSDNVYEWLFEERNEELECSLPSTKNAVFLSYGRRLLINPLSYRISPLGLDDSINLGIRTKVENSIIKLNIPFNLESPLPQLGIRLMAHTIPKKIPINMTSRILTMWLKLDTIMVESEDKLLKFIAPSINSKLTAKIILPFIRWVYVDDLEYLFKKINFIDEIVNSVLDSKTEPRVLFHDIEDNTISTFLAKLIRYNKQFV